MIRTVLIFLITVQFLFTGQQMPQPERKILWRYLDTKYLSLAEVRPVLKNENDYSIFIDCNYACGCVTLKRKDELTGNWQNADCQRRCSRQVKSGVVEIKPGEEYSLKLYWDDYMDSCDKPRFILIKGKPHPHPGKYKIAVECFMKIENSNFPIRNASDRNGYKVTSEIVSPEFEIEY